ncbi:hypothetical protein EVAR_76463_1 [Eumeta japonica]|uniref:Uncharacterized protein n=1 Tax=Eumeta variegata TaxID=151549 RepID=A0A4C1T803_EUMVA|nr:hypothetical protein EVAR_76463_1 [Eumeta japonica]
MYSIDSRSTIRSFEQTCTTEIRGGLKTRIDAAPLARIMHTVQRTKLCRCELVTKASQWRKIGTRGKKRGRGALYLRIAAELVCCTVRVESAR